MKQELIGSTMHAAEYALLAILIARALIWGTSIRLKVLTASFILAALYSISDETHQLFVPGRAFQLTDLALDWLGSLVGLVIFALVSQKAPVPIE